MNVTRDLVTDLLPVYFSGEASEDTRTLVEDYFRENPDFERIARSAATPLETLRAAAPTAPAAEREKRDLECIGWELRTRRVWLVLALLYTILPFASLVGGELAGWLGGPHTWGGRVSLWGIAAFFWVLYIIRLPRRNGPLAGAILVSLGELALVLNRLNIIRDSSAHASGLAMIGIGILAAFLWIVHFRWRALARR
ncbi:MAG: hypothetical protein ACRD4V_15315 [Candidatus Acidiferrales bacterium]